MLGIKEFPNKPFIRKFFYPYKEQEFLNMEYETKIFKIDTCNRKVFVCSFKTIGWLPAIVNNLKLQS